jgi:hypothetical protein
MVELGVMAGFREICRREWRRREADGVRCGRVVSRRATFPDARRHPAVDVDPCVKVLGMPARSLASQLI